MKHAMLLLIAGVAMIGLSGCSHPLFSHRSNACPNCEADNGPSMPCRHNVCEGQPAGSCPNCGGGGTSTNGTGLLNCHRDPSMPDGGSGAGGVTYPYYTLRGPRDYFTNNPPSIGP